LVLESRPDVSGLLREARDHQGPAIDRLLEVYRNYLRLLARTWLNGAARGNADASDLVQETLLKAHRAFPEFRGNREEELVAWLRRILARQLTDLVRRLRSQRLDRPLRDKLHDMATSSFSSPSGIAQRRELGVVLADALAQLSPARREVIVLRNLEELDWPEVARRMGKSEAAVRKLWARALLALRPLIDESL
jgi:RNA polymerase sigma-70 factor (ECF subfamily)